MLDASATSHLDETQAAGQAGSRSQWAEYMSKCLLSRLSVEEFSDSAPAFYRKHPLPPAVLADICLRPQPSNHESLDPRIPRYLQVLTQHGLVDTQSILYALYKYSTSHSYMPPAGTEAQDQPASRWANSYTPEENMFYRLSKAVRLGKAIKSTGEALGICGLMAKWMTLFTTAAAAFAQDVMGQLQNNQSRDEMEATRAAFVMFLLAVCEDEKVLLGLSRPAAKSMTLSSLMKVLLGSG